LGGVYIDASICYFGICYEAFEVERCTFLSCIDLLWHQILFSISKLLLDTGFVPADSKKVQALETVPLGVQGTIIF
jgi:hypothetical protein